jgi:hypothetical protein
MYGREFKNKPDPYLKIGDEKVPSCYDCFVKLVRSGKLANDFVPVSHWIDKERCSYGTSTLLDRGYSTFGEIIRESNYLNTKGSNP